MKSILIRITTDSELIGYEAIALAFVLATFDHQVAIAFGHDSHALLTDRTTRVYGMVQSLDLYDISLVWHEFNQEMNFDDHNFDDSIAKVIYQKPDDLPAFDTVFHF